MLLFLVVCLFIFSHCLNQLSDYSSYKITQLLWGRISYMEFNVV